MTVFELIRQLANCKPTDRIVVVRMDDERSPITEPMFLSNDQAYPVEDAEAALLVRKVKSKKENG